MAFNQDQFVTINSGQTVSSPFKVGRFDDVAIRAPVVTSCQLFFGIGEINSPANLPRAWKEDGSGQFAWALAAGSASLRVGHVLGGAEYAALEASAAQTDVRTFVVMVRG